PRSRGRRPPSPGTRDDCAGSLVTPPGQGPDLELAHVNGPPRAVVHRRKSYGIPSVREMCASSAEGVANLSGAPPLSRKRQKSRFRRWRLSGGAPGSLAAPSAEAREPRLFFLPCRFVEWFIELAPFTA